MQPSGQAHGWKAVTLPEPIRHGPHGEDLPPPRPWHAAITPAPIPSDPVPLSKPWNPWALLAVVAARSLFDFVLRRQLPNDAQENP